MKSVGEVMAVGRSFEESSKALRLEIGLTGLNPVDMPATDNTLGELTSGWLGEFVPNRVLRCNGPAQWHDC